MAPKGLGFRETWLLVLTLLLVDAEEVRHSSHGFFSHISLQICVFLSRDVKTEAVAQFLNRKERWWA